MLIHKLGALRSNNRSVPMMHHPSIHPSVRPCPCPSVQELVHPRGNKRIVECSQLVFIRTAVTYGLSDGAPSMSALLQCRLRSCVYTHYRIDRQTALLQYIKAIEYSEGGMMCTERSLSGGELFVKSVCAQSTELGRHHHHHRHLNEQL